MTTIEPYRPPLQFPSDATSTTRRTHSSSNTIVRNIPPAVPSPPRLSTRNSPPRKPKIPSNPPSTYTMAADEPSQWLFTDEELLSTPSIIDGLDPAEERCRRAKGVNFITQVGILLKLPQLTIAVASIFFQRFYMRRSMVPEKGGLHHYSIAATALFLATKTEENCRKTKEIVIAVAKVAQKNASLIIDEQSKEYWKWRDNILLYEETMLEELTFDLVLKSPHTILFRYLQQFELEEKKGVRNVSWAFLNDSCLTMMCLAMPAKHIAIGALYFACKFHNETIPDDDHGQPWWEQLGGVPEKIVKAVSIMADFWSDNPLKRPDNPYGEAASSGDDLDLTRRPGSDGSVSLMSQNGDAGEGSPRTTPKRKLDDEEEGAIEEPVSKRARTEEPADV